MKQTISSLIYLVLFYLVYEHSDSVINSFFQYKELYAAGVVSLALKPLLEKYFG